jgi:oligoribonuclease (3'-5' exoribonuclease)
MAAKIQATSASYGVLVDLTEDSLDPVCDRVIKVADIVNDAEVDQVFAI